MNQVIRIGELYSVLREGDAQALEQVRDLVRRLSWPVLRFGREDGTFYWVRPTVEAWEVWPADLVADDFGESNGGNT